MRRKVMNTEATNPENIDYKVHKIELSKILADASFNCRGTIAPIDVVDLAKDIEQDGLQNPIIVQHIEEGDYDFRIISGHRRFTAFRVLKKEKIPAFIRDELTEVQARILNLNENLQREELDFMQEARAIEKLKNLGVTQEDCAAQLKKSRTWVQVRFYALELPPEIQEEIALGFISQADIHEIRRLPNKEAMYEAVRNIKDAVNTGKRKPTVADAAGHKVNRKKIRGKNEIFDMQAQIHEIFEGNNIITKTFAWCAGEIDDREFHENVEEFATLQGINYTPPRFD